MVARGWREVWWGYGAWFLGIAAGWAWAEGPSPRDGRFIQEVPGHRHPLPGLPPGFKPLRLFASPDGGMLAVGGDVAWRLENGRWNVIPSAGVGDPARDAGELVGLEPGLDVRQVARRADGLIAVATDRGLFERDRSGAWQPLRPADPQGRLWTTADVRGVCFDRGGHLWCTTAAGIIRRAAGAWLFFTGREGVPVTDLSRCAAGADGSVWFGSRLGAVRYRDAAFAYRQGPRWLPGDDVHDVAVAADGTVWLATDGGLGRIEPRLLTFTEKAAIYEEGIERSIRRTEQGFVASAVLAVPGDPATARQVDSDNDGLWTAMYGAAECFAFAVTADPGARRRAEGVFRALAFLQDVTQGGAHAPPPGFPARTVLPGTDSDPNVGQAERDRQLRSGPDPRWKVLLPRWPRSADGRWWWKADTSSDELDGHYFFLALYHDLVAATPEERARVATVVARLTDHLLDHDLALVDHDGLPTRWGVYGPAALNHDPRWSVERGLNSVSILAYLAIAAHVTGDGKYAAAAATLRRDHAYDANAMVPKVQRGIGSGNQSDDEMAFMSLYHLVKYTPEPDLRRRYLASFHGYWLLEQPERNPFFHVAYAGAAAPLADVAPALQPGGDWLEDTLDSLRRLPLDRCSWPHANAHRADIVRLPPQQSIDLDRPDTVARGLRFDGKVLPVDERFFAHFNHDPWRLDTGGDGRELASGTVFLLPYWMARHHGFIGAE
ncbi:MAG: hypothetical protein EBR86_07695 [Planctomycetia bacterium]|nr:hypothetical protein [Planctomycetia bacterium]